VKEVLDLQSSIEGGEFLGHLLNNETLLSRGNDALYNDRGKDCVKVVRMAYLTVDSITTLKERRGSL
jgi:hypothetical protein